MPSQKTRMMLTVPDDLFEAIGNLAAVVGKPKATIAVEMLEEMRPAIDQLTKIMRAIKEDPGGVSSLFEQMAGQSLLQLGTSVGEMSKLIESLPSTPSKKTRRRRA